MQQRMRWHWLEYIPLTLLVACGSGPCTNNTNTDAGVIAPTTSGDGTVKVGGVLQQYAIVPDQSELFILVKRAESTACGVFHSHAIKALVSSYTFALDKDVAGNSTLTAKVQGGGLDPDQNDYRTRYPETADVMLSESDRRDIRNGMLSQLDVANHPELSFTATALSTLDGAGNATVAVNIRGSASTTTINATATWTGTTLVITGKGDLDGSQHGLPNGALSDCVQKVMGLDFKLTLQPGAATDAGVMVPDSGPLGGGTFYPDDAGTPCGTGYQEVRDTLLLRCGGCHSDPPKYGASVPLVTWENYRFDSVLHPQQPIFEGVAERIQLDPADGRHMPPVGSTDLTADERAAILAWTQGGARHFSCDGDGAPLPVPDHVPPDAGHGPACGTQGYANVQMFIQRACLGCHAADNGSIPPLAAYSDGTPQTTHPAYAPLNLWETGYLRMVDNSMPPGGLPEMFNDDVAVMQEWVMAGAPQTATPCVVDAGMHDAGGAPPLTGINIITPNGGENLSGMVTIEWAKVPSGASFAGTTVTVALDFGSNRVNVSPVDIPNTGSFTFDTHMAPTFDGNDYKVHLTVKSMGGPTLRADSAGTFTINNGGFFGTTLRYDGMGGVKANMDNNCASCHVAPPLAGAPDYFVLDRWETNDAGPGAFSQRANIKARVENDTMPPGGGLTPADKAALVDWAAGGAPR